ncbi:MAG: HAD-IIIA family hydrolase [Oligoflexales bacterium]|nr:HAD-IIIA family hydrolase [Oligoflexales bacterium]
MTNRRRLILLDRDGVLNRLVIDKEHGTVDSPLHPSQVELYPDIAKTLLRLNTMSFALCIVSNQPAAAKGKTTLDNLKQVHNLIVQKAQEAGAIILSSHLCFHRAEDHCSCRKPRTGLLEEAMEQQGPVDLASSWMVGDGFTDIDAGKRLGLKTAFLGPKKCDHCKVASDSKLQPEIWCKDLAGFAQELHLLQ